MGTSLTTPNNAFRYPAGLVGEPPDVPDDIRKLALDVEAFLLQGTWTPSFGGASTALGANGTADGTFLKVGKHVSAKGRLLFGSSASFGNGTPVIGNWPGGNMDIIHSTGYGWFTGSGRVPLYLFPNSATWFEIRSVQSAASGSPVTLPLATGIGTPAQSSELRFTLDITLA